MRLRTLTLLLTILSLLALPSWGNDDETTSVKVKGFGNRERPMESASSNEEHRRGYRRSPSQSQRPVVGSSNPFPYQAPKSVWGESLIYPKREKVTNW